jgi:hypothetical protein
VSIEQGYRVGALSAVDLGLRPAPAARAVGFALLVLVAITLFDGVWRSAFDLAPVSNPFSGVSDKSTATIVLAGIAVIVTAAVEEVFLSRPALSMFSQPLRHASR